MIIKITGSFLVLLSASLLGFKKSGDYRRQYCQMDTLRLIFLSIQSEMRYSRTCLGDIFYTLGLTADSPYGEWLMDLWKTLGTMNSTSFSQLWNESIDRDLARSMLPIHEKERLKAAGERLGGADIELQQRTIDLYVEHISREMDEMREDIKNKVRMSRTLGFMGGLVIILILL